MRFASGTLSEAAPAPRDATQAAQLVLTRWGGRRGQQALALFAAYQVAKPVVEAIQQKVRRHKEPYSVTVLGTDDVYPELHEWVLSQMPQEDRKAVIAVSHWTDDVENDELRLALRYDGSRVQEVRVGGYDVSVQVEKEEITVGRVSERSNWREDFEKIVFTTDCVEGRDAVLAMIGDRVTAKLMKNDDPPLFIPERWGGHWTNKGDLPQRPLDSVTLKKTQMDRLVGDLETFLAAEDRYARFNQPWHRGYLFHGPAGTGKTSAALALAHHFKLPIYYLPLGDLEKDADLMQLVAGVRKKSVLLLEDVDVFHAATSRTDSQGTTIATMLNTLDGLWTPHGLITIMTTNNKGVLDDALIRAGRVDVDEEFSNLDGEQARSLADWFGEQGMPVSKFVGNSPADLIQEIRNRQEAVTC